MSMVGGGTLACESRLLGGAGASPSGPGPGMTAAWPQCPHLLHARCLALHAEGAVSLQGGCVGQPAAQSPALLTQGLA